MGKIICGLKITHDGAVALSDGDQLVFCHEMEKINNNPRFQEISNTDIITDVLALYDYSLDDVETFVVDGWEGIETSQVNTTAGSNSMQIPVAPYTEGPRNKIADSIGGSKLKISGRYYDYLSFTHAMGHIMSAYGSSPFAVKVESSFVLVWDGGMFPRLYYFDQEKNRVIPLGIIFTFIGNIYSIFAGHFHPFNQIEGSRLEFEESSIAGKAMAYIALGQVQDSIIAELDSFHNRYFEPTLQYSRKFSSLFSQYMKKLGKYKDEDILASFHVFLEHMLISGIEKKIRKHKEIKNGNICLSGGCALNIKWNSAIRNSKVIENVWVPPFPNDSGSAIGAMLCAKYYESKQPVVNWNVYSGPSILESKIERGWSKVECGLNILANLLHSLNEPIMVLNDRAELGPRALGNRSLLAKATDGRMKSILNTIKNREEYRPVAPICLEEDASNIFDPGHSDPYMIFEHYVEESWLPIVPAIVHLDGTARLQTITVEQNPTIGRLLQLYKSVSGIPLLCNTSANGKGKGFFPDVMSAMRWGRVNFIWSNNILYIRDDKNNCFSNLGWKSDYRVLNKLMNLCE